MKSYHLKSFLIAVAFVWILAACSIETESQKPTAIPEKSRSTQDRDQKAVRSGPYKSQEKRLDKRVALPNKLFEGIWVVEGSSAEFKISFVNGRVKLTGNDDEDREDFKVSSIEWNQSVLKSSLQMPSTSHTLKIKLTVMNKNELQCEYSGDASGEAIWKRKGKGSVR